MRGPLLAVTVLHLIDLCTGLRLTNMTAPALQDPRKDMELHCRFDMGLEDLYAVKWYKDDQEFFRFSPTAVPEISQYPVMGVHVNRRLSKCTPEGCDLLLQSLTRPHSSGAYRCEVSSEAPAFRLASQTHNVTVVALPDSPPVISGVSDTYHLGDRLVANCTSGLGDPTPILTWYIDQKPIDRKYVTQENVSRSALYEERFVLTAATSQIRLPLDKKLTQGRAKTQLRLACESSADGIRPVMAPPLAAARELLVLDQNQIVNNQKLHSPWSGGGRPAAGAAALALAALLARCC